MKVSATETVFGPEDLAATNPIVTTDNVPLRAAHTVIGVFSTSQHSLGRAILLVDPDEAVWNTWMFPFASSIVETATAFRAGMGAAEVVQVLRSLWEQQPALAPALLREVAGIAGWRGETPPLFREDYALRYSKSANCWSAYHFHYFLFGAIAASAPVALPHAWLSLREPTEVALAKLKEESGKTIAANVQEFVARFGEEIAKGQGEEAGGSDY